MLTFLILLRAVLRLLACGLLLSGGALCVALLFPWLGYPARAYIKRRWSQLLVASLGVGIVSDAEPATSIPAGLVVANHVSFLDIFVINAIVPVTFVSKSEVERWPLIGWLTARTDNLFIERGRRQAAHLTRQRMAELLSAGRRLVIFPEGTTTVGTHVLPFHAALLQSAVDSKVPVVCLALAFRTAEGAATTAPAYVDADTLWDCLWRIVCSDGLVACIVPAGSLPAGATDRRELARLAHRRVSHALDRAGSAGSNVVVIPEQSACHDWIEECETSNEPDRRTT